MPFDPAGQLQPSAASSWTAQSSPSGNRRHSNHLFTCAKCFRPPHCEQVTQVFSKDSSIARAKGGFGASILDTACGRLMDEQDSVLAVAPAYELPALRERLCGGSGLRACESGVASSPAVNQVGASGAPISLFCCVFRPC